MKSASVRDLPTLASSVEPIALAWRAFARHARPGSGKGEPCLDCRTTHDMVGRGGPPFSDFPTWHGFCCDAGRPLLEEWHLKITEALELFAEKKR